MADGTRKKIALVVVGMHRSGTSAMARLLSLSGAALPSDLMAAGIDNPTGFWESTDVARINDQILAHYGSAWDDVFSGAQQPFANAIDETLVAEAASAIYQLYGPAPLIVLKDPRVSVLGRFWRAALEQAGFTPRYVIMVRNPLEVAASLAKRNGFSREKSLLLWSSYMIAAERDTRDAARVFVSYDHLLGDWRSNLTRIERELGLTLPGRTPSASVEADRFLTSELRHHAERVPLEAHSSVWAPAKSLHAWFTAAAEGETPPNLAPEQVEEELSDLRDLFGPILAEAKMTVQEQIAVIATLRADNERERREGHEALTIIEQQRREDQEALAVIEKQRQQDAAQFATEREIRLADLHRLEAEERQARDQLEGFRKRAHMALEKRDILLVQARKRQIDQEQQIRDELDGFRANIEETLSARDISLVQARKRQIDEEQKIRDELDGFKANIEETLSTRDISLVQARKRQIDEEQRIRDELDGFKANIEDTLSTRDISLVQARKRQIDLQGTVEYTRSIIADLQSTYDRAQQAIVDIEAESARQLRALADAKSESEAEAERQLQALTEAKAEAEAEAERQLRALSDAKAESEAQAARQLQALADAKAEAEAEATRQVRALTEANAQAGLTNHTLQRQLSEQAQSLALLEQRQAEIAAAYSAIATSTTWRVTAPVRQWMARHPGLSTRTRQVLKLIYWTVSLKLPERLKQRRQFMNAQAAERMRLSSVAVGQDSLTPTPSHAPPPPAPKRPFPWSVADAPNTPREILSAYDLRPDDAVPPEADRGRQFMERFDLLGSNPRFSDAVAFLNARSRPSLAGPHDPGPDVSIIIPVYGQLAYTLNCLDSLIGHETRYRFEILIGDDGSPDDSGLHLPNLLDITHVRHSQNKGFIRNCNNVAERARGHYVVMLNNDVRVVAGWLDELIGSFTQFPKAGLVGSKLFYPDGSLQEAGGIIWQDGSAWNYGRDDDPNRPQYSYARQVDYISGASIAVPTDLWHSLGGFDEAYAPAYCEDSDLAFRIRDTGHEVWMQPLSRVIHYEGKTSGTDLGSGAKAYQVINQERLKERWASVLADHRPNGVAPEFERERKITRRVLVIDATAPTPDQDAGSVTTVKVMEVFQALDYKVTYIPLDNWLYQPRYIDPLMRRGIECVYAPFHLKLDAYLKENGHLFDVVHVFRFNVMQDAISAIKKHCPQAQIIFNNMDLHYLRVERQAGIENSDLLRATAKSLKATELVVMEKANVVCVPSTVEKALLDAESKLTKPVAVMPFMIDLPERASGFGPPRRDILFLGGYGHSPNIDAAVWMAQDIWPLIRHRMVGSRLVLAGANPTPEVLGLASSDILVPGRVDDLSPLFASASVFVAPLRYGAGVKGKIYSAFGAGVPVVSTAIGVEGMNLTEGTHALIADDPAAFADAVLALASDQQRWTDIAEAGWTFVRDHHGIDAGCAAMRPLLNFE